MTLKKWIVALIVAGAVAVSGAGQVLAASNIAVVDFQAILGKSEAGKSTKGKLESRMKSLQSEFKEEQEKIVALQGEIEKKSSAWSEEKSKEKMADLRKMRRDLQLKNEDAKVELKQLQDKELKPILSTLKEVVDTYGAKNGYSVILEKSNSVVYFDKSVDITDAIIKELNAAMAKK